MRWPNLAAMAVGVIAVGALSGCAGSSSAPRQLNPVPHPAPTAAPSTTVPPPPAPPSNGTRRNIVFVLTDDLSTNLVRYMPHVQAMMAQGMSFTNYNVTNSLCCPSRASILTGDFPHNTGVQSNDPPYGGYDGFQLHNDETRTFAVALRRAGYATALMGKYLNGYDPQSDPRNPPGWSTFLGVDVGGYRGYGYYLPINGRAVYHAYQPRDYVTTVLDDAASNFISTSAAAGTPFALEVAPFTPHSPYSVAPADVNSFRGLRVPRTPAFNTHPANAPDWLSGVAPLDKTQLAADDADFNLRVESVQSVDRMIGHLQQTLRAAHQLSNTMFVFSSDNGYHMSEYGLSPGKLTAFDTDVNVPLIIDGPGVAAGSINTEPVENIDLAPTFEQLAEAPIPSSVDGHSIVALLHAQHVPWRTLADVEHASVVEEPEDPDIQPYTAGVLPVYKALRSTTFTYVEYSDGEHEYYDRATDPYELDNIYATLPTDQTAALHNELAALSTCKGYSQCWAAGLPTG